MTNEDLLYKHIIPVIYHGGTGGHFVAALLNRARNNKKDPGDNCYGLSEFGNCHRSDIDLGSSGGLDVPFETQMVLLRTKIAENTPEHYPCYPPMHLRDWLKFKETFERTIKIIYDQDDVVEIGKVFLVKWGVDENLLPASRVQIRGWGAYQKNAILRRQPEWSPETQWGDRVANISWRELTREDPQIVTDRLSRLTGLAQDHFDMGFMEEWRRRTRAAIDLDVIAYLDNQKKTLGSQGRRQWSEIKRMRRADQSRDCA